MKKTYMKRVLIGLSLLLSGCHSLPSLDGRTQSAAYTKEQVAETYFAQALAPLEAQYGTQKSGIFPLIEADEAFAARMMLASTHSAVWMCNITSGGVI